MEAYTAQACGGASYAAAICPAVIRAASPPSAMPVWVITGGTTVA